MSLLCKGKFYIRANIASATPYFWMQHAQNFTSDPEQASFWHDRQQAEDEAEHASAYASFEVQVLQATRDIA